MNRKLVLILSVFIACVVFAGGGYFFFFKKTNNVNPVSVEAAPTKIYEEKHESTKIKDQVESFIQKADKKDESEVSKQKQFRMFLGNPLSINEFNISKNAFAENLKKLEAINLPTDQKNALMVGLKKIFDIDAMYENYLKKLYENFSEKELAELNEVYSNPMVVRAVEAEQSLQTPEGQKEFMDFVSHLSEHPLSEERKKMLKTLDNSIGMTTQASLMFNQMMDVMGAVNPHTNSSKDENKALQQMMNDKINEIVMLNLAKSNNQFSDEQLAQLIQLRSNPAAVKEKKLRVDNYREF
ncbi:MAG: hypothetical protein K2X39_03290, partial [Silvanigrellaceae bacterium]|nr:hypothetical protein [Silvanigrellaceae bacterium]